MTLIEYIQKLDPVRRNAIHFSRLYMYIYGEIVWDLQFESLGEQPDKVRENALKKLRHRQFTKKNIFDYKD